MIFIENIHKVNKLFSFWMYILENIHIREEYFKKRRNTTDMLQFTLLRRLGLKASYTVCVCVSTYTHTQTYTHKL